RSRAIDRVRSRQRKTQRKLKMQGDARSTISSEATPMEVASQREEHREVQQALTELPSNQQEVLRMMYYDGLTQAEISQQLNIPIGTVKSRSRRGLLKLHDTIEGQPK
ncbi:MAG: sigma-70 family RNA polymerase sigma factor, partial [Elainellaceae cyanobacterium]